MQNHSNVSVLDTQLLVNLCYRLESAALLLADQLNAQQALGIAETLEEMQSRNFQLINK